MIASGEINVGLVINVLFAVIIASFSLSQVAPRIENFAKATAAAQKIFQTIYRVPSIDSLDESGEKPKDLEGNIEFQNVSFIYPSRPEGTQSPHLITPHILASVLHLDSPDHSHRSQERVLVNPSRQIHRRSRRLRLRQINNNPTLRTFLRPRPRHHPPGQPPPQITQLASPPRQHVPSLPRTRSLRDNHLREHLSRDDWHGCRVCWGEGEEGHGGTGVCYG